MENKIANIFNPELIIINYITNNSNFFDDIKSDLYKYIDLEDEEKRNLQQKIVNKLWKSYKKVDIIYNVQETLKEFEKILSILNNRDHFLHQFKLFLLGSYIILAIKNKFYMEYDTTNYSYISEILFGWLMCATFHDMGYPVEQIYDLNELLREQFENLEFYKLAKKYESLDKKEIIDTLYWNVSKRLKKYQNTTYESNYVNVKKMLFNDFEKTKVLSEKNLLKFEKNNFNKEEFKLDHGVLSSMMFLKKLVKKRLENNDWKKYKRSNNLAFVLSSATGMFFHNIYDKNVLGNNINFNKHPILWLLILVDEIHEWQRENFFNDYKDRLYLYNIENTNNKITISYKIKNLIENSERKTLNKIKNDWSKKQKKINAHLEEGLSDENFIIEVYLIRKADKIKLFEKCIFKKGDIKNYKKLDTY